MARLVVPGYAHHVTQRGNRRQETFFCDDDYATYLNIVGESCAKTGTEIWGYCLMPNHVHLIMVPSHEDGLRAALSEAHRQYTRHINFREGWRGYLWQGRFHSFAMDEQYLMACARYVELNPVRAGMVEKPEDWQWSSARAHLSGEDDGFVSVKPMLSRLPQWQKFLAGGVKDAELKRLRSHSNTGRPCGVDEWLKNLEVETGKSLQKKKPGPKLKVVESQMGTVCF